MRVLIVTNMYPDKDMSSMKGIFVKDQVDALTRNSAHEYEVFNIDSFYGGQLKYLLAGLGLAFNIIRRRPDIIHIHYGLSWLALLFGYPLAKMVNAKLITTYHGSDILGASRMVRWISIVGFKLSDHSIAVSSEIANKLKSGCFKDEALVIPCSVSQDFINSSKVSGRRVRELVVFPSDPNRKVKNFARFKRVVARAKIAGYAFDFVCLKGCSREEVIEIFSKAGLLLLTSDTEGSPQVVKEAIAMGLPVISMNVGDVAEVARSTCSLKVAQDEDELFNLFCGYLRDGIDCSDLGYSEEFESIYSETSVCQKILGLYTL